MLQLQSHTHEKAIPHSWGFGEAGSFKETFTWPEFDFDLEEEAETSRGNDLLLERLHDRLIVKSSELWREH